MTDDKEDKQPPPLRFVPAVETLKQLREGTPPDESTNSAGDPPRPPWTWSLLSTDEAAMLAHMIHTWVISYNQIHATRREHIVPACWPAHPGLATELAVWVWHWHDAHTMASTPAQAAEFYTRHLPAFKTRIREHLGSSPDKCQQGEHVDDWRYDTQPLLETFGPHPTHEGELHALAVLDYGFEQGPTWAGDR